MAEVEIVEHPSKYRRKHDASWPVCPGCEGAGVIDLALAQKGLGARGETCKRCGGIGRALDPSWPACRCCAEGDPAHADPDCVICVGHGRLSPMRQEALAKGQITRPCAACKGVGSVPIAAEEARRVWVRPE